MAIHNGRTAWWAGRLFFASAFSVPIKFGVIDVAWTIVRRCVNKTAGAAVGKHKNVHPEFCHVFNVNVAQRVSLLPLPASGRGTGGEGGRGTFMVSASLAPWTLMRKSRSGSFQQPQVNGVVDCVPLINYIRAIQYTPFISSRNPTWQAPTSASSMSMQITSAKSRFFYWNNI